MVDLKDKKALVVGGSNGIGLAIALALSKQCARVVVVDRVLPDNAMPENVDVLIHNLVDLDMNFLDTVGEINVLIVTAGFGRIAPFESVLPVEIDNEFKVNAVAVAKIVNRYFVQMKQTADFFCAVMGSIAGLISSPMIALYGATKAAVCKLTESLNIELEASGSQNRILNVSPGSFKGSKFNGSAVNQLDQLSPLADAVLDRMFARECLYIPEYESVYKGVLDRYAADAHGFGLSSYHYKQESGRINGKPQVKIGYLSGTFDLFHIGHLNMLRQAKQYCDYLVVGVHKDASHKGKETFIPLAERMDIVRNIRYVDEVILSLPEDDDIYRQGIVKYDYLFVGSDYKGSERFNRYEAYFADKDVKIIYFPYTKGTSSTQLREALDAVRKEK